MAKEDKVTRFIETKQELSLDFKKKKKIKITDQNGNEITLEELLKDK